MPQPSYCLGIDLGTTYSAAAVYRDGEPRPRPWRSATGPPPSRRWSSSRRTARCCAVTPRSGGRVTDRGGGARVQAPDRRPTPLVVGGTPVRRRGGWPRGSSRGSLSGSPARRRPGRMPSRSPTRPSGGRTSAPARGRAGRQGITGRRCCCPSRRPRPSGTRAPSGSRPAALVAVYDLGGGTFDAAVVRKRRTAASSVLGKPVGIERLGGIDFDEAVFDHVRAAIGDAWQRLDPDDPAVQSAVAGLRRSARPPRKRCRPTPR